VAKEQEIQVAEILRDQGYKNCPPVKKMVKENRKSKEWKKMEQEHKDFLQKVSTALGLPDPIPLHKISGVLLKTATSKEILEFIC
jgi:hypothetical protein